MSTEVGVIRTLARGSRSIPTGPRSTTISSRHCGLGAEDFELGRHDPRRRVRLVVIWSYFVAYRLVIETDLILTMPRRHAPSSTCNSAISYCRFHSRCRIRHLPLLGRQGGWRSSQHLAPTAADCCLADIACSADPCGVGNEIEAGWYVTPVCSGESQLPKPFIAMSWPDMSSVNVPDVIHFHASTPKKSKPGRRETCACSAR
jgi:hypothetical protein